LGRELVRSGVRVTAVVPQAKGQPERTEIDGVEVFSFPSARPGAAYRWLREIDADIYHSVEPSLLTHIAARARPARGHVVTVLDPALDGPCAGATEHTTSPGRWLARRFYRRGRRVRRAVQEADHCFVGARHIGEEVSTLYKLATPPCFVPRPIHVPETVTKAPMPTVCMLDRWDRQRRPELFFGLAERFPHIHFVAAGSASTGVVTEEIRREFAHLPNLELRPPLDPFSRAYETLLTESWILVNPAQRTGLPTSFLDAAAHGTALLSTSDPDDFSSNFGIHAEPDALGTALEALLRDEHWRKRGEMGRAYVGRTFEAGRSIQHHTEVYRSVVERKRPDLQALPPALELSA